MNRIVSTVYYEGTVYIFTEQGGVYCMVKDVITAQITFQRVAKLELR